jgi:hypothetical protein
MGIVDKAIAKKEQINAAAQGLPDGKALELPLLFDSWADVAGKEVAAGYKVRHNDMLYKCVQSHTVSELWTPDITPALWARISIEEFPEWVQPLGGHDAYGIGSKVTCNGAKWESTINANVYAPGVYGWKQI